MRTRFPSSLRMLALIAAFAAPSACKTPDRKVKLECDLPYNADDIAGTWRLTAHGRRYGCQDRQLEGTLDIETKLPLEIQAKAQPTPGFTSHSGIAESEADAFVERIAGATFTLNGTQLPAVISFSGQAHASCVSFTLTEDLHGDRLVYMFDGEVDAYGHMEGNFTGKGPETCGSSGTFIVTSDPSRDQ